MNTSRSKAALFDVRATDRNHDIFHTADKTDTRRHSLTGRKHHAQCLLTKQYYVHSTKPIRLRMERTVSQTLRQTRGEGNTKRFKQNQRKTKNRTRSPHATLSTPTRYLATFFTLAHDPLVGLAMSLLLSLIGNCRSGQSKLR